MGAGGKLGKGLLCEVQEVRRDEGAEEGKAEERQASNQGHMPEVQHKGIQNRRLGETLLKTVSRRPLMGFFNYRVF
jgi:hypothetical protein